MGNTKDRRTPVTNLIDPPLIGYSLRIHPEEWHGHIAMRVGLYGCTSGENTQTDRQMDRQTVANNQIVIDMYKICMDR